MSDWLSRARAFAGRYPRFFRTLFFVGLMTAVALPVSRLIPRSQVFVFEFPRDHEHFHTFRVAYLPRGQAESRASTWNFRDGAPATFRHEVELAPGHYEIHARLEEGREHIEVTAYETLGRRREIRIRVVRAGLPGH